MPTSSCPSDPSPAETTRRCRPCRAGNNQRGPSNRVRPWGTGQTLQALELRVEGVRASRFRGRGPSNRGRPWDIGHTLLEQRRASVAGHAPRVSFGLGFDLGFGSLASPGQCPSGRALSGAACPTAQYILRSTNRACPGGHARRRLPGILQYQPRSTNRSTVPTSQYEPRSTNRAPQRAGRRRAGAPRPRFRFPALPGQCLSGRACP